MSGSQRVRLWVLTAFVPVSLFVAMVAWGFASPTGASPDDDFHQASIWCSGGEREGFCETGENADERYVAETLLRSSCYAHDPNASASCADGLSNRLVNTDRGNFIGAYPPVFYSTMAVFSGPNVSHSVLLMRTFNALIFVSVVFSLFLLLAPGRRGPLIWGTLVTIVPLGMFIIPSINPSSWAVISGMTLWVALHGYFREESSRKRMAFGAIATLMTIAAAGARADSAMYSVLAIFITGLLAFERSRRFARLAILPLGLILISGVFFLAAGQASVINPSTAPTDVTPDGLVGLTLTNLVLLPHLWSGALGTWGLGWLDTGLPATVWFCTILVFGAVVFWGLQRVGRRKGIALGLLFLSLVIVPLYILVKDRVYVGADVQPRYIYPLLIMFAGVAILRMDRDAIGLTRFQISVLGFLVALANAVALHTNIRRYVTGLDAPGFNLDANQEWWWNIPISPLSLWAIGSLSFACAVGGIVVYLWKEKTASIETASN